MVSSTTADLAQYRHEAYEIIERLRKERERQIPIIPIGMGHETQTGDRARAVATSKGWVEGSEWVVFIVAWNYGTISDEPGAEGLSVTEWEYRHAEKLKKKLFVFMPGERGTLDQYRCSEEEVQDLKDWLSSDLQSGEHAEKLLRFKQGLKKNVISFFTNLEDFRQKLDCTLKRKLDARLREEIPTNTPLHNLIVKARPAIRNCSTTVRVIANCKSIYNHLHDLLQMAVGPVRDEVLRPCEHNRRLSSAKEKELLKYLDKATEKRGSLIEARNSLDRDNYWLSEIIDRILGPSLSDIWASDSDAIDRRPTVQEFLEIVEGFYFDVQQALVEADEIMTQGGADLREQYAKLHCVLADGRKTLKLSPKDEEQYDTELEWVGIAPNRLKRTLKQHHQWQRAHNSIEEVDMFRGQEEHFKRILESYRELSLRRLLGLIEQEVKFAEETAKRQADEKSGAAFLGKLHALRDSLKQVNANPSVNTFDKIRKPFCDLFHSVGEKTLKEIKTTHDRVDNLTEWMDGLPARQTDFL